MIIYKTNKGNFLRDVEGGSIADIISTGIQDKLFRKTPPSEYQSWQNSLQYMFHVLNSDSFPNDIGVAIEYVIPRTNNRLDFIITGQNVNFEDHAVLVELKQWSEIGITQSDGIVETRFKQGLTQNLHPSYQVWSYAALLQGFNTVVYDEGIKLVPCVYLHNYTDTNNVLFNDFYKPYLDKAPAFIKGEKEKLQKFIQSFIKHGDKTDILYRIENGEIRPSKALADSLVGMLKGNKEFVLVDNQKIVYERAIKLSIAADSKKKVLIVKGGPGTGKSVVAINLLVELTKKGLMAQYVTRNSAPRAVYADKLLGERSKAYISSLFKGSGSYIDVPVNGMNTLIVDEAHRLTLKSGMMSNLGENQIKEIMSAAKCSIFFIDEDQKVTLKDIGTIDEILKWAKNFDADVEIMELESQFRCSGSNGYLAWLDDILGIKSTANKVLDRGDYDFQVIDDPNDLRDIIFSKNAESNKARIVAGYCWDWKGKSDSTIKDIVISKYDFKMAWNLGSYGLSWIIQPDSVNEIGCIHTCQGLEADYIGVIVGDDIVIRDGEVYTDVAKRSKMDRSVYGYKSQMKSNPSETHEKLDKIIKNTYRTLMSRGMKGCYVHFTDKETADYFKSRIS